MIKEKELKAALNKTDLCLRDKNEVFDKLSLSGLVKREEKYCVVFNSVDMRFKLCKYITKFVNNEVWTVVKDAMEEEDALELIYHLNGVLDNNGKTI